MVKQKVCIMCGEEYSGRGNNALPIKDGLCCDSCNYYVIIERLKILEENIKNG